MSDSEEISIPEAGLNERQIRFAREYVIDLNVTQAYIRAGYEVSNENSASACGSRLLAEARVAALVARFQRERADRLMLSADYALSKLRSNLEAAQLSDKYSDVNKAAELLLKHFGELTEKHDVAVEGQVTNRVIFEFSDDVEEPPSE